MKSIVRVVEEYSHVYVGTGFPSAGLGGGGSAGEVFALDVTPTSSGIVSAKTYVDGGPELDQCMSDTTDVRVYVGCEGGQDKYKPTVTVNGVTATLTETTTKRWFTGYADIVLAEGINTINVVSDAGGTDTVQVEVLGAGPSVSSVAFGAYPGVQTELKAGDHIGVTIHTAADATSVTVRAGGAANAITLPVTAGTATGTLTISSVSGAQPIVVYAQNSFGTAGIDFTSTTLTLNQTYPTISTAVVAYPVSQNAINVSETAQVTCTVVNANTVTYSSSTLSISDPSTYADTKSVTTSYVGYEATNNYTVTATRDANGAVSTYNTVVRIASVAPTGAITISGSPARLLSSPSGTDYEIRVTPSQAYTTTPTLTASIGTWQGSWTYSGTYWKRNLRITDAMARGAGVFSALTIGGPSGIAGSAITSGANYTVGGFSSRTLTYAAFTRVTAIGSTVADQTKTSCQIAGGSVLTRYTDNAVHTNGYYIANADGTYNANGGYIGLSDSAFAGANTTGALQITVQEAA